jgi:hypothetical protein
MVLHHSRGDRAEYFRCNPAIHAAGGKKGRNPWAG